MIHLIAEVGDKRTICALKDKDGPAVPYMLASYADGREVEICPDCQQEVPK